MIIPYLNERHFELVHVEYVKEGHNWFLRVFVDKEGGIDIDDCSWVSEIVSEQLDKQDLIKDAYFLEVCSPGAERPLIKPNDFFTAVGKHVYITTNELIDDKKKFEGKLVCYDEQTLMVQIDKQQYVIPHRKVASARLGIKW